MKRGICCLLLLGVLAGGACDRRDRKSLLESWSGAHFARRIEIEATIEGRTTVSLADLEPTEHWRLALEPEAEGSVLLPLLRPWLLDAVDRLRAERYRVPLEPGQLELLGAQLTANDRLHVQFRYRVAATVSFAELSADGRVADDYRGTLELSFRGADEPVRVTLRTTGPLGDERPEIERWRTRSVLRVAAIFGQMSTSGALNATDDGIWSYDAFRTFLATVGFHFDGEPGEYSERGVLELKTQRIVVDLVHPRDAPPRASDVNRWLERVTPDHDLVYYNGHAFEGSLEALRRLRRSWSERYVLLYLDSCYSQRDYGAALRGALAEASVTRATVDVLVNHRLTITASVEGFIALFGHLLDALATVDGEAPPWRIFLDEAQQGADARAMRRRTLWPATPYPDAEELGLLRLRIP